MGGICAGGKGGAREGSVMPSRYPQPALLAVVAVHALAFELQDLDNGHHALGDSEYFAGNGNYAASSVMPQQVVPLRFTKTSKKDCAKACDEEGKCVGFKYGGEGCTLMQNRPVEQRGTPERMKTLPKNQSRKLKKAAGARLKFVPNKQAAVATAVLEAEVGRMSNNKLRQVESVAEDEEGCASCSESTYADRSLQSQDQGDEVADCEPPESHGEEDPIHTSEDARQQQARLAAEEGEPPHEACLEAGKERHETVCEDGDQKVQKEQAQEAAEKDVQGDGSRLCHEGPPQAAEESTCELAKSEGVADGFIEARQ